MLAEVRAFLITESAFFRDLVTTPAYFKPSLEQGGTSEIGEGEVRLQEVRVRCSCGAGCFLETSGVLHGSGPEA